jgi:hypothetical protein
MLLAIDPGNDTGWALFDSQRRLTGCGLGEPKVTVDPDEVIIECPVLRPREKNPNSILKVARNAGEWAGRFDRAGKVRYLSPNDWKGSTPKDISNARTWAKLDSLEQGIVDEAFRAHPGRAGMAPSKRHNVLDAIGLGLHGVGR